MLYPTNANHKTALLTLLDLHSFNVQNVGTVCRGFRSKFRPDDAIWADSHLWISLYRSWIFLHLHIYPPIQSIETTYMHLQMGIQGSIQNWVSPSDVLTPNTPGPMPHQTFTKLTVVPEVLQGWFLRELDENQVARTSALLAAAKFKIIPFLEVRKFPTQFFQYNFEAWEFFVRQLCFFSFYEAQWLL